MRYSLLLLVFTFNVSISHAIKLGTYPIPLMVESADKGIFVELSKELAKRSGVPMEIIVAPPKRTLADFSDKSIDALFSALDVLLQGPAAKTTPVYVKVDFIFFKKGTPFKTLADLKGKTVGITAGYPYVKDVTETKLFTIEPAPSDEQNIMKLEAGRIAAFIVEEKTGLKALAEVGVTDIAYAHDSPISKQDVFYAFQNTTEGQALAEKFSGAIKSIQSDGTFQKLMAPAH